MRVNLLFVCVCAEDASQLRSDRRSLSVDSDGTMDHFEFHRHATPRPHAGSPDRARPDGPHYTVHSLLDYRHRAEPAPRHATSPHLAAGRSHLHALQPHQELPGAPYRYRPLVPPAAQMLQRADRDAHANRDAQERSSGIFVGGHQGLQDYEAYVNGGHQEKHAMQPPTWTDAKLNWMVTFCTNDYVAFNSEHLDSAVIHGWQMNCTDTMVFDQADIQMSDLWDPTQGQLTTIGKRTLHFLNESDPSSTHVNSNDENMTHTNITDDDGITRVPDPPVETFNKIEQDAADRAAHGSIGARVDVSCGHHPRHLHIGPKIAVLFTPKADVDGLWHGTHKNDANIRRMQTLFLSPQQFYRLWYDSDGKGAYGVFLNKDKLDHTVGAYLPCVVIARGDHSHVDSHNTYASFQPETTPAPSLLDGTSLAHTAGTSATGAMASPASPAGTTPAPTAGTSAPGATASPDEAARRQTTTAYAAAADSAPASTASPDDGTAGNVAKLTAEMPSDPVAATLGRPAPADGTTTASTTWVLTDADHRPNHGTLYQQLFGRSIQFPSLALANEERERALAEREKREDDREREFAAQEHGPVERRDEDREREFAAQEHGPVERRDEDLGREDRSLLAAARAAEQDHERADFGRDADREWERAGAGYADRAHADRERERAGAGYADRAQADREDRAPDAGYADRAQVDRVRDRGSYADRVQAERKRERDIKRERALQRDRNSEERDGGHEYRRERGADGDRERAEPRAETYWGDIDSELARSRR